MKKEKLNLEEKDILNSLEKGEWKSVSDFTEKKALFKKMAKQSIAKTKRITLRVTEQDYNLAHIKAIKDGIPYQTMISSIIHRYLTGQLKEA